MSTRLGLVFMVEVTLVADNGATVLTFVHHGLPLEEREQHGHGRAHFLDRLHIAGAGGDPGPDPMIAG